MKNDGVADAIGGLLDSYNDEKEYARSTTNLGNGWMQVNDNDVWHDGGNLSKTKDRYSMLIALTIMTQYPTA